MSAMRAALNFLSTTCDCNCLSGRLVTSCIDVRCSPYVSAAKIARVVSYFGCCDSLLCLNIGDHPGTWANNDLNCTFGSAGTVHQPGWHWSCGQRHWRMQRLAESWPTPRYAPRRRQRRRLYAHWPARGSPSAVRTWQGRVQHVTCNNRSTGSCFSHASAGQQGLISGGAESAFCSFLGAFPLYFTW